MILDELEVKERLESPLNLLNRLKAITKDSKANHPSIPPTSKEIIEDLEEKLQFGSIKSKAAGIMISAMDELKLRLPDVERPEKLAQIAAEMSKVVNAETKSNERVNNTQFTIFAPSFVTEEHFDVVHARE